MAFTALNASVPHPPEVDTAFASNNELRKRVHAAIDQNPTSSALFRDISTFILDHTASAPTPIPTPAAVDPEPAPKKRRLDAPAPPTVPILTADGSRLTNPATKPWKAYPGTSFSLPARKKFCLELLDGADGGVRATGANGVEFAVPWKDVEQVFCVPVPEKAKKQWNFVVVPRYADGVSAVPEEAKGGGRECVVWTFEEVTGKNVVAGENTGPEAMVDAVSGCLRKVERGKDVVRPDAKDFASAVPESHRKSEKAYHVKAHRGSKEGFLFFTSAGILHAFKKPLLYFDFAFISSISYTAVLRNTFNLVISTPSPTDPHGGGGGGTQDFEFGMLDQADFAGINEYVQRHGLQDASLAAARMARKENVNKKEKKGADGADGADEGEEESEIQKAERELQEQEDAEDEDEEDYDPGSEGESEGEGSESGDDEGDGEAYDGEEGDEEEGLEDGEGMEE